MPFVFYPYAAWIGNDGEDSEDANNFAYLMGGRICVD